MDQGRNTTVVLADDHVIVREGIAVLCASHNLRILEQCSDGPAALEAILRLKPDIAILDLQMPGMTGVEVIRRLRGVGCTTKLMILSISCDDDTVMAALRDGVDALPFERWALAASAGCHQLCPGWRDLCIATVAGCRPVRARRGDPAGGEPTGLTHPPRDGGSFLSGERDAGEGYRRTPGHKPQNREHVPRQSHAQVERSRSGGTGQIRH